MSPKTLRELHGAVTRELEMRRALYPSRVQSGKIKQTAATHEMDCMADLLVLLGWVKTCKQVDGTPLTELLVRDSIISPAASEQPELL